MAHPSENAPKMALSSIVEPAMGDIFDLEYPTASGAAFFRAYVVQKLEKSAH